MNNLRLISIDFSWVIWWADVHFYSCRDLGCTKTIDTLIGGLGSSSSGGGFGGSSALSDVCTADDRIVPPFTIETFFLAQGAMSEATLSRFIRLVVFNN